MGKDEINAFLGEGTVYEGKLQFQGAVRIDGVFSGEIQSDGTLIVGKDASVKGTLDVGELLLFGHFNGEVHAKRRITIHKTGVLQGTTCTSVLLTEEGGVLEGQVQMRATTPEHA